MKRDLTHDDYATIGRIADRAVKMASEHGVQYKKMDAFMDLAETHKRVPLRLAELKTADDGNFAHDVFGIRRHINRTTCELENCFLPRFAA